MMSGAFHKIFQKTGKCSSTYRGFQSPQCEKAGYAWGFLHRSRSNLKAFLSVFRSHLDLAKAIHTLNNSGEQRFPKKLSDLRFWAKNAERIFEIPYLPR
jgi:hypothetical protein